MGASLSCNRVFRYMLMLAFAINQHIGGAMGMGGPCVNSSDSHDSETLMLQQQRHQQAFAFHL